jgi:hypothetical protein
MNDHVRCAEVYETSDPRFWCPGCGEYHCFCEGACDDMPEHCDVCWSTLSEEAIPQWTPS